MKPAQQGVSRSEQRARRLCCNRKRAGPLFKNLIYSISGCSAVGSAPALGACPAVIAEKIRKSRKAFKDADFRGFKITQKSVDFEFDHSLSHFHAKRRKIE